MAHREHDWVTGERGQVAEATVHGEAAWWLRLTGEKEGDGYAGIPGGMGWCERPKRCAGVRRIRQSFLRSRRQLDGGNDERQSCGGGGNRGGRKENDGGARAL
jgi:hypothetical protein